MKCRLTSAVGAKMAELSLPPPVAAALLKAGELGCSSEVATVAAILQVQSIWYGAPHSKALRECKLRFAAAEGAHRGKQAPFHSTLSMSKKES
jgi:ATP-dependent RNA helicase DDX35